MMLGNRRFQSTFKDSRRNRIDQNAVRPDFVRQATRQSFERAFARGVMHRTRDRARAGDR